MKAKFGLFGVLLVLCVAPSLAYDASAECSNEGLGYVPLWAEPEIPPDSMGAGVFLNTPTDTYYTASLEAQWALISPYYPWDTSRVTVVSNYPVMTLVAYTSDASRVVFSNINSGQEYQFSGQFAFLAVCTDRGSNDVPPPSPPVEHGKKKGQAKNGVRQQ